MSTPATPVSTITDGVSGLQDNLLQIAGVGIGIGAVVLAVRKGWSLVRKFF
jgi:hypothetical protein